MKNIKITRVILAILALASFTAVQALVVTQADLDQGRANLKRTGSNPIVFLDQALEEEEYDTPEGSEVTEGYLDYLAQANSSADDLNERKEILDQWKIYTYNNPGVNLSSVKGFDEFDKDEQKELFAYQLRENLDDLAVADERFDDDEEDAPTVEVRTRDGRVEQLPVTQAIKDQWIAYIDEELKKDPKATAEDLLSTLQGPENADFKNELIDYINGKINLTQLESDLVTITPEDVISQQEAEKLTPKTMSQVILDDMEKQAAEYFAKQAAMVVKKAREVAEKQAQIKFKQFIQWITTSQPKPVQSKPAPVSNNPLARKGGGDFLGSNPITIRK